MVNFNYAAKYGTKFQDFGSWVDVDYEEFLADMKQQPELFYINSYIPFMGVWKQKLTETGRVAKNEAVWIPIKECVVVTTPHAKNVLLLFPNLDENVLPRLTFWEAGATAEAPKYWTGLQKWSGYTKRFIDAFVNTGKMDWNRVPIPDSKGDAKRNRFKRNLREWLKFLDHSWYNPVQKGHDFRNYWNVRQDYYLKQNEIEDEAREKFVEAVFHNAKAMNDNYEATLPIHPPYYLQSLVSKNTFLSNLQGAKNQYEYAESGAGGGWWNASPWLDIKVLTEIRGLSPQGGNIKLLNWNTSTHLLDYLDIAPNPLRPFLWDLELNYTGDYGMFIPYGANHSTNLKIIRSGNTLHGLLPLNRWRSVSPTKEWRNYSLGIESEWDVGEALEAETFEANGSRYPPRYMDLSQTGVCFVVTPHFQEMWFDELRYGPNENESLPDTVGSWQEGWPWFWEEVANAPMNDHYYYIKVRKDGRVMAFIYFRKKFNRSRGRQEIELITVTPPSHPTGFGGVTIFGIPHTDTTEYSGRMPFNAESFEWEAHDYTSVPLKGFCPICGGPIPNAEHRGQYPGALSRYDNETEICSLCGSAEALAPMMDEDAKITMQVGYQNRDWDIWRQGVNLGRGAVKDMMDASQRAAKIFKEGKFKVGDVTVEIEDITDEYMERNE